MSSKMCVVSAVPQNSGLLVRSTHVGRLRDLCVHRVFKHDGYSIACMQGAGY
jgi:hypothetical protein